MLSSRIVVVDMILHKPRTNLRNIYNSEIINAQVATVLSKTKNILSKDQYFFLFSLDMRRPRDLESK